MCHCHLRPRLKKYLMCITDGWPTVAKMTSYILEADDLTAPAHGGVPERLGSSLFPELSKQVHQPDGQTLWLCYSANFSPAGTR